MQSIHGVISMVHKETNSTIVQNDVIERWFINSMNMAMDAQYVYGIMQLIMMYEYAIKVDHNKFAKEMYKLIYHGWHRNTRFNKAIIMCVNPCIGCKLVVSKI